MTGLSGTYDFQRVALFYAYSKNEFTLPVSGAFYGGFLDSTLKLRIRTHEVRLGSSSSERLRWTVGFYRREALRNDVVLFENLSVNARSRTELSGSALFGEAGYRLESAPIELTLGLRSFRDRLYSNDSNAGESSTAVAGVFNAVNPRYGVAWVFSTSGQIYASAARGFRSGQGQASSNVTFAKSMGIDLPKTLAPDSVWSYELGSKLSLLDRRLVLEGAIYKSDWKNFAVRVPLGSTGLNGLLTSPGTTTYGVEASIQYLATRNLSLSLNGGYVRGRYAGAVPGTAIVRGTRTDEVPPVTWGGSADYLLGAFCGWSTRLSSSFLHSAKRMAFAAQDSRPGDTINNLSLRLAIDKGPWAVALFADNLTNDGGGVSSRTLEVASDTEQRYTAYRLRPRTIGLQVQYSIGK